LAGDIGNPYSSNYDIFMKFISKNFKKAFVIAGNHEYYNKYKNIEDTNTFLANYFKKFNNISFLNNTYEYYDNYCFIGTTLWSKITNPDYEINDVYSIPNFDYITYNKLNKVCVEFLENTVQENSNCIIISHHIPSNSLIDMRYKTPNMLPYNQWFYCNMDEFIKTHGSKIKCWIYGHTHTPSNNTINGIPFLCNPIGYPNENTTVDFGKTITISRE
jgi:predicted phosphohydrolase